MSCAYNVSSVYQMSCAYNVSSVYQMSCAYNVSSVYHVSNLNKNCYLKINLLQG